MTEIEATQRDAYRLLHNGILAFSRAEQQGIRIDLDYCEQAQEDLTAKIRQAQKRFYKSKFYRGWKKAKGRKPNIDSNAQLGWYLYDIKGIKPTKTTETGKGSTDEETLLNLGIDAIDDLLRVRKLKKVRDTYLNGFVKEHVDGYIHPHFNLHIARTFRSSSSGPNFQNIPKRDEEARNVVRQALYPRPGHQLLEVDYSGIEVRISTCYHHDPTMIKYIENPASDMHGDMAEQIFFINDLKKKQIEGHYLLRSAAKNGFVFPQFYGDYYGNCAPALACNWGKLPEGRWGKEQGIEIGEFEPLFLSDHMRANGIKNLDQFEDHVKKIEKDFWGRRFKVYAKWKEQWYKDYCKKGYIEMLTGFKCYGPMSFNDATNYPIQGTAFHCLLWSFIETDRILRKYNFKTRLIGQIHDAMVLDVWPPELSDVTRLLRKVMVGKLKKQYPWIIVPLDIEMDLGGVDQSWNDLEPYKEDK